MEHTEAYKGDVKQVQDPYRRHFVKNTQFHPQPPHPEKVGVVHTTLLESPENAEDYHKQVCGKDACIVTGYVSIHSCFNEYWLGTNHTLCTECGHSHIHYKCTFDTYETGY